MTENWYLSRTIDRKQYFWAPRQTFTLVTLTDRVILPSFYVHTPVTQVGAHEEVHDLPRSAGGLAGIRGGGQPPHVSGLLPRLASSRASDQDVRRKSPSAPRTWLGRSCRHGNGRTSFRACINGVSYSPTRAQILTVEQRATQGRRVALYDVRIY